MKGPEGEGEHQPIKIAVNVIQFEADPDMRDPEQQLLMEIVGTMMLVFAVLVSSRRSCNPSLRFGFTVTFIHLFLSPVVGNCGINPARSFGVSLVTGEWSIYHWVFWIGPILGGILGGLLYRILAEDKTRETQDDVKTLP